MFDRYTEGARLVIFWARYEASAFGSAEIDATHLLLGVIKEGRDLLATLLARGSSLDLLRSQVAAAIPESHLRLSTSVDMPLSTRAKDVLERAAEESDRLGDPSIRIIHLLLGLGREPATQVLLKSGGIGYEHVLKQAESARPATGQ